MDRREITDEMRRAQADFHALVARATPADLRRRSDGTRWTNRQLMFHMVFGYLIVRTLLPLVHLLGRLGWSRRFAATLNALNRPFHLINYAGSCGGGLLLSPRRMAALMDTTIDALSPPADRRNPGRARADHALPVPLGPLLQPTMTVLDVYHYGTEHYDHHHDQLTLT